MAVSNSNIKYYYTTATDGAAVTDPSLSVGGYPSSTEVDWDELFNSGLSDDLVQYRCVAVRNQHASDTAYSMSAYLKETSANTSTTVEIAVEQPATDAFGSTTGSTGTTTTVVDPSLGTTYDDNELAGCTLVIVSGANAGAERTISSYDADTHTFVVSPSFASAVASGVSYRVKPAASSRLVDGTTTPTTNSLRSAFSTPSAFGSAISINVSSRSHGSNLMPNDVTYVWFKRTLTKNRPEYEDNTITLAMRYSTQ